MPDSEMTIEKAQELALGALFDLPRSGDSTFEEFVAAALTELTGQAFYVAKSGHQHGIDARSVPHNLLQVGAEVKQYAPSTWLSLDALLHKITDASTANMPVDVWLLAATRPVDATDRGQLHEHGQNLGIGVVVVDCPANLARLGDLAALCASAPETWSAFICQSESLNAALERIRQSSQFQAASKRLLEQLTRADTGYASARRVCECWLDEAQASLKNAKSRLGGHNNLRASEYGVIPRAEIHAQLNDWYASGHGVVALLGDEGMGKTWAVLDWHAQLRSKSGGAPLTVFLSADSVGGSDVKPTLAKALADQTDLPAVDFWKRRLALWEKAGGDGVRILILLDGLNENFSYKQWARWLQPLFEDPLGGMYRVIVSCWPNWWKGSLYGLANLVPRPHEITVEGFNDAELQSLLAAMQVDPEDLTPGVLKLMRVPRLSSLVAKHRERLKGIADVTAEHVAYEDWKDRIALRGNKTGLSDPEMQDFVARLGLELQQQIDRTLACREILDKLSERSGKSRLELESAIAELSSGAWLMAGEQANSFKVAPDRIPFVLGAALVAHLKDKTAPAEADAGIAEFLDPLKAHRLGAAILNAATTIALLEKQTPLALRETLLARWLDERHFGRDDFEDFWRLAGLDPALFLDLAEVRWLAKLSNIRRDEVLIKSFSNAAVFGSFATALKARLTKWLGTAWPDPRVGAFLRRVDQTQPDSLERAAATRLRHEAWASSDVASSFAPVRIDSQGAWTWLSARALAILSYARRAGYAGVLEAWALSRAVMRYAHNADEVAWLLRFNLEDAEETAKAVWDVISRLEDQPCTIGHEAAGFLRSAVSHVDRASEPLDFPQESGDVPEGLDVEALDADELRSAVRRCLSASGGKDYGPEGSADLINALIERGLEDNRSQLGEILGNLREVLIVLTPSNRERLQKLAEEAKQQSQGDAEAEERVPTQLQSAGMSLQLYGADPATQSSFILESGIADIPEEWLGLIRPVTIDDIAACEYENEPPDHIAGWLAYLCERLPRDDMKRLNWLPSLVTHENPDVRHNAIVLAAHGRHNSALATFAASRYARLPSADSDVKRNHEYWRNRALLESCEYSPDADMMEDLSPDHIALIVKHGPNDAAALRRFHGYLRGEFEAINSRASWSCPRYWESYKKEVEAIIEHDLDGVLKWLEPWLEDPKGIHAKPLMNPFPVIDTMQALRKKAPEVALAVYDAIMEQSQGMIWSTDEVIAFPFQLGNSPTVEERCERLLREAKSDQALSIFALEAHSDGLEDRLFDRIEEFHASSLPADVAKAYTLLGYCDVGARAEAMWEMFMATPPRDQWLANVLRESAYDYEMNRKAREAFRCFLSNDSPAAARFALKQFVENCDSRHQLSSRHIGLEWEDWPYDCRVAYQMAIGAIRNRLREKKKQRKKRLFHTPPGFSNMAPWM